MLPPVKLTDLLVAVDYWTGFTVHFTHLKTGEPARDKEPILAAILADGTNLGLAKALREMGRLERTLFTLRWLQEPDLRQRVTAGLNKGEARNALARAVFFNRLGESRDRSYEDQMNRAGGLALLTAAIALWNAAHLPVAVEELRSRGEHIPEEKLSHLSPLGWEHITLTGIYHWDLTATSTLEDLLNAPSR